MNWPETDLVIIGGGPAGCAAAIAIAQTTSRCLILEKGSKGKDKPCGDALLPSALDALTALGVELQELKQFAGESFTQIELLDEERVIWRHSLRGQPGWVIPRKIFDQHLREIASQTADLRYDARVTGLTHTDNGQWVVSYTSSGNCCQVMSKGVILATGASNALSINNGISGNPLQAVSITAYAKKEMTAGMIFQFSKAINKGYGWVFKCGKQEINIGICALEPEALHLRQKAADYLQLWDARQEGYWRGGAGPLWSGKGCKWHCSNGLLSCGDAAGLVDPINGEGISAALVSGREAGKAMSNYLAGHREVQYLEAYSDFIRSYFSSLYSDNLDRQIWRRICNI